jgi:hemolysin D
MSSNASRQLVLLPQRNLARKEDELAFLPAALEIIETPASPAGRLTLRIIVALVFVAILWACLGKIDIIATASGRVIPSGKVKLVQPLESGIIKAIHVADGDRVRGGDVLIEIDPTANAADQERLTRDLMQAELDVARLTSLVAGKPEAFAPRAAVDRGLAEAARDQLVAELDRQMAKIHGLDQQMLGKAAERDQAKATIAKLDASLPFVEQRAQLYEKLRNNQFVSKVAYLEAQQALTEARNNRTIAMHQMEGAEAAIAALEESRREVESDFRRQALDDLAKARQKAAEYQQEGVKARQRIGQQILRAAVDGTVEQLAVHTIGGVVSPAQTLMVIVPDGSRLEVEAMLPNREVGFVQAGQAAEVKVEAFTYTRYGLLEGRVEGVSRDAVRSDREPSAQPGPQRSDSQTPSELGSQGDAAYVARISLKETSLDTEQGLRSLEPGMMVTAEIKTGQRRIIEYLLSPLMRYQHEALKER